MFHLLVCIGSNCYNFAIQLNRSSPRKPPELPVEYVHELPPAVVREYGHQMANHIFLKVPNCGEHWKIELRTSPRRDRMWLEKGWEEFASFYLLDQGDMATFSFEGEHSHFHVSIYSWDDMEIKYPIGSGGMYISIYGNFVSLCLEICLGQLY